MKNPLLTVVENVTLVYPVLGVTPYDGFTGLATEAL